MPSASNSRKKYPESNNFSEFSLLLILLALVVIGAWIKNQDVVMMAASLLVLVIGRKLGHPPSPPEHS